MPWKMDEGGWCCVREVGGTMLFWLANLAAPLWLKIKVIASAIDYRLSRTSGLWSLEGANNLHPHNYNNIVFQWYSPYSCPWIPQNHTKRTSYVSCTNSNLKENLWCPELACLTPDIANICLHLFHLHSYWEAHYSCTTSPCKLHLW